MSKKIVYAICGIYKDRSETLLAIYEKEEKANKFANEWKGTFEDIIIKPTELIKGGIEE